ncbi:sporulation protein Cse60 [Paenibacillus apiarius]|uniref:sporulation protein Cse60 n=1 Tax=Paenibacillus apiarius TaxID=46240 RepID=UPI003B3A2E14
MIQVKEFLDLGTASAEKKANEFLATLEDEQVIEIKYSAGYRSNRDISEQRSCILVIYRTNDHTGMHEP